MELSQDQEKAVELLLKWFMQVSSAKIIPSEKLAITLGGYAGTGKTTLIGVLRKRLKAQNDTAKKDSKKKDSKKKDSKKKDSTKKNSSKNKNLKVAFCSYTGKAARVLKHKLEEAGAVYRGDSVSTIHSLIYSPITDKNEEIVGWEKKDALGVDLIIIDEASMVDEGIWRDLVSYRLPIIAVGDHGQLPPIAGQFNLMESPLIRLERIHRQAEGNPIIEVATIAREQGSIPVDKFGDGVRKWARRQDESREVIGELLLSYNPETMVLCGFNHTRVKLNQHIRQTSLGFRDPAPQLGDRVICLRNNHKKQIFNGMLGEIENISEHDDDWYYAEILFQDEEKPYKGLILKQQFGAKTAMNFGSDRRKTMAGDLFDFGYALTVHKAQGSQSKRVILFEERFSKMDDEMWQRWLYTAVTRAEEELYIFGE